MPSKKKRFSRSKRYNPTIRRNKNKLKKIQTGGTKSKSDILVETSSGHWVDAYPYQKKAFRDFIQRYKTDSTFSNIAGNFNPENRYTYDKEGIKFTVFGEMYIVRDDGSRMRIKSVLRPEGSPERDYLLPEEVQIQGLAIKNIGTVRIGSTNYPLFYKFIPGHVLDQIHYY